MGIDPPPPTVYFTVVDLPDEPPKPVPKPKGLQVKLKVDDNHLYTASWGSFYTSNPPARSAATALRLLANLLEASGQHGSDKENLDELISDPHALCKYCFAPIFFAHLPLPSTKFLAFDVQPVDASLVKGIRTAMFSKHADPRGRPYITWVSMRAQGPVWIPHPEVCGDAVSPENDTLRARWQIRHETYLQKRQNVIERIRTVRRNLNEGILDAE